MLINNIAIPSRLSLWIGILIIAISFFKTNIYIFVLGSLLVLTGIIIWFIYKDKDTNKNKKPNIIFRKSHLILSKIPFIKNTQLFYKLELYLENKNKKIVEKI